MYAKGEGVMQDFVEAYKWFNIAATSKNPPTTMAAITKETKAIIEQTNRRTANAKYLTQLLNEIPGIKPAKLYDGVTRSAYHLYMFRYDPAQFAGLSRGKFMEAMGQEGVPCSGGYGVLNKDAYVSGLARNKHFLKLYGEQRMKQWLEQNRDCPQNEKLCAEAVWLGQNLLLGSREDMEQIAAAVRKIQKHAGELAKK
jgi:perosamine synthetase